MLALTAVASCKRGVRAGAPCRLRDELSCVSPQEALACEGGTWVAVPCRGHHGCARAGETDQCDDTIAREGDKCPRNPPLDYACTADGARALVCTGGRFSLWRECRGPDQCRILDERNLRCDTTLGAQGDPCAQQGTYSCAVDHGSMLVCNGATLAVASTCRGPSGCVVQRDAHKVDCDDSLASEGDDCDRPKRIACSLDRKTELVCEAGHYSRKRDCPRRECRLEGTELFCE